MAAGKAEFVRYVLPHERMDDLIREAKALTYEHFCEHALLRLENGRRVMVKGGPFGIDLKRFRSDEASGSAADHVYVEVGPEWMRVIQLIFHTHPKPTGPSDDDLLVLRLLGQRRSMLYELFGPIDGTPIRPKES